MGMLVADASARELRVLGTERDGRLKSLWRRPAVMVAVALAMRLVVVLFSYAAVANPAENHAEFGWEMGWVARSIFLGHGFAAPFAPITGPTALVPPMYSYLLAMLFKCFGLYSRHAAFAALSANSLFSALTCLPIYYAAKESLGVKAARWAGWAWAVYPFAIFFSGSMVWDFALTCMLFTTCFWLSLVLRWRRSVWSWAGFGLLCGITALSNPSVLSVLPVLLLIAAWKARAGLRGSIALAALVLTLVPWSVRNFEQLHQVVPVRDGFWLEFWAGNANGTWESNPAWAHPASSAAEMKLWLDLGETRYLASKHTLAVAAVRANPGTFVVVSGRRFVRYWTGFWSFEKSYLHKEPMDVPNLFFCTALTVGMLLGAWRWCRQDLGAALPYVVTILIFPLPYYVTHSSMDYRQPIEAVILMLIVAGFQKKPAKSDKQAHVSGRILEQVSN